MGKKRPKRACKLNWKVVFAWFPFLAFFHTMRRPTLLSPCLKQFSDFVGHSVLYTLVKFYTTTLALASLCQHFTFSAVLEGTEYIWYFWQIQTNDIYNQVQFFTFHLNFYDRQIQYQCFTRDKSPLRLLPFRLLLISICQVFRQRCNIAKRHFFWRFQLLWIPSQNGHRLLHPHYLSQDWLVHLNIKWG